MPNSRMGDMMLTNFSRPDSKSEFTLTFCLDSAVPTDRALRVLTAAAMAAGGNDAVLEEPKPKVQIKGPSTNGVDYEVKYWVDTSTSGPGKPRHRVVKNVLDQLHQAGISLAHAQQDLFYAPMPNRILDARSQLDRVELLKRIELFSSLEMDEFETLATNMKQSLFPTGSTLLRQGDPGESMFIVFEGLLHVLVDFEPDQGKLRVGQVHAGEFFGEMSLLTGEPRSATITAATETLVYEINKELISGVISNRPELVETMSRIVAKRRLMNSEAYTRATAVEQEEQHETLARQIMNRVRAFFRNPTEAHRQVAV